ATRRALAEMRIPMMNQNTHIVPVLVGDAALCQEASKILLEEFAIYIQPINYPTVRRGTERLRITPTPAHDDRLITQLAIALRDVWERLELPLSNEAAPYWSREVTARGYREPASLASDVA